MIPESGVRLLRQGQVDAGLAPSFGAERLAEVTHLPTGTTSNRIETVTIPPGGSLAERCAANDATLFHVVAGQVQVLWGSDPERKLTASPGDTVLVPAGIAVRTLNDSPVEALQLIVVRGN